MAEKIINKIKVLQCPSQSSDLNLIEMLWDLKRAALANLNELKQRCKEVFHTLPLHFGFAFVVVHFRLNVFKTTSLLCTDMLNLKTKTGCNLFFHRTM